MFGEILHHRRTALALAFAAFATPAFAASPERVLYVLDDANRIGLVVDAAPGTVTTQPVTGIAAGDTLVAIDVRPQNNRLYGLGFNSGAGTVQLYHIDLGSGVPRAFAVGTTGSFTAADGTTPVPVAGTAFGIDFNPTVDRVRVVNDAGQNFRMNPNTGAFVDGNAAVANTQMDGALNGPSTAGADTAYTNEIVNATVTTQYTLSSATNSLYIQNPPNNGTLTAGLAVTVGGNPLDFDAAAGFDIPPGVVVATSSTPAAGVAYAALRSAGTFNLYFIDLASGAAVSLGALGGGNVVDVAIAQLVPAALAMSSGADPDCAGAAVPCLYRFALDRPDQVTKVQITGLAAGERLVGFDLRPNTGQYFGLGVNDAANTATLYRIDPQPGTANVATAIGATGQVAFVDAGGNPVDLPTGSYGFDFNPTVDRVRVVAAGGRNFRINPDTGAPVDGDAVAAGVQCDADINGGGITGASGTAYAASTIQPPAPQAYTTQFTLDSATNQLSIQNPPNNGTQTASRALSLNGATLDFLETVGFDVPSSVTVPANNAPIVGDAYAALTPVGAATGLYRVSLASGAATLVGPIGSGAIAIDGLFVGASSPGPERGFVMLTDTGQLALFSEAQPARAATALAVTGLGASDTLVAIDVRPQNNRLYGLGFNGAAGTLQLYHLDLNGGAAVATAVGASGTFVAADGTTPVQVAGTSFGMDFNPTVDRVRVVTNAGQNFRMNPNNGAFVDGDQGGAAGSIAGLNMDGSINGGTTTVDDTAYTNNGVNATATTQYTIDSATNALYIQNPPNTGTQTSLVAVTLNAAPLDFTSAAGFDIPPRVGNTVSASPVAGHAYASLTVGATDGFYRIDLGTGAATLIGAFGGAVRDVATVSLPPAAFTLDATGTSIARFELARPETGTTAAVTGVAAGERLVGIDIRPATGQFYGLGVDAVTNTGTVYRLDPQTGAATAIGTPGQVAFVQPDGTTPVDLTPGSYGVDFNPTVDRIRVVSDSGLNFRAHPDTGAAVDGNAGTPGTQADGVINGATTALSATAYSSPYPGTAVTTQYTLSAATDALHIQNPPNNGTQTLPIGITLGGVALDFANTAGFDIVPGTAAAAGNAPATGSGYAALTAAGTTRIFRIDLATGAATVVGTLGNGLLPAEGLTVGTAPIEVSLTLTGTGGVEGGDAVVTITRSGGAPLVVNYATESRTALAGIDYMPVAGALYFAANEFTKQVTIPVFPDTDVEGAETFALVITGPFVTGGSITVPVLSDLIFSDGYE
jgi:hypothetical protein